MSRSRQEQEYWCNVWIQALKNMPEFKNPSKESFKWGGLGGGPPGAQGKLARLLGYYCHSPVWSGYIKGSKPKGDRATKLLKLAGPYGRVIAIHNLKKKPKYNKDLPGWSHRFRCEWGPAGARMPPINRWIYLVRRGKPVKYTLNGYEYLRF